MSKVSSDRQMMDDSMHKYSRLVFEGGEEQQFSVGHISIVGHTAAAAAAHKGRTRAGERATHVASAPLLHASERAKR